MLFCHHLQPVVRWSTSQNFQSHNMIFLSPIRCCQILRITTATPKRYRRQGNLHNRLALSARYITTSRGILLLGRGARSIQSTPWIHSTQSQKSTKFKIDTCSRSLKTSFSSRPRIMTAEKIDGTAIAKGIRTRLHAEIKKTQETNPRYKPSLTIVQGTLGLDLV